MSKQTTVEWLQLALEHTILNHEQVMQTIGLFEQAKEMEREQIIETWHNGYNNQSPMIDEENCGNTYYKKTFGIDE